MNRFLTNMRFNTSVDTPIIKLFGARRKYMPMEYIYYHFSNYAENQNQITRVNQGGTCRLVAVYHEGSYFDTFNLPFAILVSSVI